MPYKNLQKRRIYQCQYHRRWRALRRASQSHSQSQIPSLAPHVEAIRAALDSLKTAVTEAGQATRQEPWRNKVNREILRTLQTIARALEALGNRG